MEHQQKLKSVQYMEQLANRIEFTLTSRAFHCSMTQSNGHKKEQVELRFQVSAAHSTQLRVQPLWSTFRLLPFNQIHDKHPSGGIVQGVIQNTCGELEVGVVVSEQAFSYLAQQSASAVLVATVWPFEELPDWDGNGPLLVREAEFIYK